MTLATHIITVDKTIWKEVRNVLKSAFNTECYYNDSADKSRMELWCYYGEEHVREIRAFINGYLYHRTQTEKVVRHVAVIVGNMDAVVGAATSASSQLKQLFDHYLPKKEDKGK